MVRTKESASGVKVGGKAPRKGLSGPSASTSSCNSTKKPRDEGGNPYCPRETPAWQKPITDFFKQSSSKANKMEEDDDTGTNAAGGSIASEDMGGSSKENVEPQANQIEDKECNSAIEDSVCETEQVKHHDVQSEDNKMESS